MDQIPSDVSSSDSVCRLCLSNDAKCFNLFDCNLLESGMLQLIRKYINLEITEDDPVPSAICSKCIDRLEGFHEFCELVITNQKVLRCLQINVQEKEDEGPQLEPAGNDRDTNEEPMPDLIVDQDFNIETNAPARRIESESKATACFEAIDEEDQDDGQTENVDDFQEPSEVDGQILNSELTHKAMVDEQHIKEELLYDELDGNADTDEHDNSTHLEDQQTSGELGELYERDHQFAGFPKVMVRDGKIVFRGLVLSDLMSRFFTMECDLCPETKSTIVYSNLAALGEHYALVHSSKAYVVCCGQKLIPVRTMADHMARHLQPSAFHCTICQKTMTCPKNLEPHRQNHLPEKDRPLACQLCPRRFSYGSALMEHAISHKPKGERDVHACDECGKSFSSPGRLSTHFKLSHVSQEMDFICHICARQFTSRSNLKYHLNTHQPRIHEVQCAQCGKWLKNKLCLRKHKLQHSDVRLNCDRCEYSASSQQCLRNHQKVQHSDDKPFSCHHCGKTFKLRTTLQYHIAQHTGVRNFSCEFCLRTFASSGNYYSHRKRMHAQELAAVNRRKEEADIEFRAKVLDRRSLGDGMR